jgi:hypothetical protein
MFYGPSEKSAAIPMSRSAIHKELLPAPSISNFEEYRAAQRRRRRQPQSQCRAPKHKVYRSSSLPPGNWFCILRLPDRRGQARDHAALDAANNRLYDIVAPRLFHPGLDALGFKPADYGTDRRTLFHQILNQEKSRVLDGIFDDPALEIAEAIRRPRFRLPPALPPSVKGNRVLRAELLLVGLERLPD